MRAGFSSVIAAALLLGGSMSARAFQMAPAPAAAQPAPAAAAPAVDVAACRACHGANGLSRSTRVPNLAGQQPDYLVAQLQAFRAGTRKNDLMEAIAAQLGDAEMNALGQYYSSHPATASADPHDAAAAAAAGPAIPSRMTLPAGFPAGFTMYQSAPGEGGATTERWANAVAMRAGRAGAPLPDGAAIVVVNRAAPAAGASGPGAVTGYAGMESRAGWGAAIPALLRNGNWDYAVFSAAGARNERLNQAQCLACHRPAAASSHVFTLAALRERAAR